MSVSTTLQRDGTRRSCQKRELPTGSDRARPKLRQEPKWPEHSAAFNYARTEAASFVAQGVFSLEAVQTALVIMVGSPAYGMSLRCEIAWALRGVVRELERRRPIVRLHVEKVVAPLLEARWPLEAVHKAAASADADGVLSRAELTGLVAQEAAWWVRLHAQLALDHAT